MASEAEKMSNRIGYSSLVVGLHYDRGIGIVKDTNKARNYFKLIEKKASEIEDK